ncbi:MAG TPA: hypothetical protein EYQ86_02880, partial [Bacteroidetes bacterium]|nr:hypothetical protein [Bacteroidota bacterium]
HLHPFPTTKLGLMSGTYKQQGISVEHRQMINRDLIIGWDFRKLSSEGLYARQASKLANNHLFIQLASPKKYSLHLNYCFNRSDNNENGGVLNENVLPLDSFENRQLISVGLSNANVIYQEESISLTQRLKLFKPVDTLRLQKTKQYLIHELDVGKTYRLAEETNSWNSGFTPLFTDSLARTDSIGLIRFKNKFSWYLSSINDSSRFISKLSLFHDQHEKSYFNETSLIEQSLSVLAMLEWKKNYTAHSIDLKYGLQGYNKGDVFATYNLYSKGLGNWSKKLMIKWNQYRTNWIYEYWSENNVQKQTDIALELGAAYKENVKLSGGIKQFKNYVYFDSLVRVRQSGVPIGVFYAEIKLDYKMGPLRSTSNFKYTYSDNEAYSFPEMHLKTALLLDHYYKKRFRYQLGLELNYFSGFNTYGYVPSLGQFYLKQEGPIEPVICVNGIFRFQLKRFVAFFKLNQLSQILTGNSFWLVSNYPVYDMSVKLGISWKFHY